MVKNGETDRGTRSGKDKGETEIERGEEREAFNDVEVTSQCTTTYTLKYTLGTFCTTSRVK